MNMCRFGYRCKMNGIGTGVGFKKQHSPIQFGRQAKARNRKQRKNDMKMKGFAQASKCP